MYGQKQKFSTFSYKLVQISPIVILVNSGAFLSISSWFSELTELSNFCHDTIRFFYWLPANNAKDYGYVQEANMRMSLIYMKRQPRSQCLSSSRRSLAPGAG